MGFDPNAWLSGNQAAPAATPAGFDPQAWLSSNQPQQPGPHRAGYTLPEAPGVPRLPPEGDLPESRPRTPTKAEAGVLGFGQGATGGWLDELAANLGAYGVNVSNIGGGGGYFSMMDAAMKRERAGDPSGVKTRQTLRDELRAEDTAAREAHPGVYGVSQLAGAIVAPGPKGVLANAALGGAYAVGASEGETLAEVATDALIGGGAALAVGGAIKGAGALASKVIGGAAGRVETRATNALLEGTPARTVQDPAIAKLGGKKEIAATLKAEKLEKLLGGPAKKLDAALEERLDDVGGKLGAIYERVATKDPGVPPEAVYQRLMRLAEGKRADPEAADAIRGYAGKLREAFNEQGAMSAQDLHEVTKVLGRRGWGTNVMNPSTASQIRREMRREVSGVLQQHVDDVAKADSSVGSLVELRKLNDRYGKLHAIADVAEAKATRDERYSPTLGQRMQQVVRSGADIGAAGGAVGALVSGEPTLAAMALAGGVAARFAPHIAAAADRLAARVGDSTLANYLRGAGTSQELLERALKVGIPREVALQAVQELGAQPGQTPPQMPGLPGGGAGQPLISGR